MDEAAPELRSGTQQQQEWAVLMHDLRTPLTVLMGRVQLLPDTCGAATMSSRSTPIWKHRRRHRAPDSDGRAPRSRPPQLTSLRRCTDSAFPHQLCSLRGRGSRRRRSERQPRLDLEAGASRRVGRAEDHGAIGDPHLDSQRRGKRVPRRVDFD